jgi:hypothetical protein
MPLSIGVDTPPTTNATDNSASAVLAFVDAEA